MDILAEMQGMFSFGLTSGQIVRNLIAALACGLLVAGFYRATIRYRGGYRTFTGSLIALAMITAVVIMVIENNLARAFGLVGAMSIIRFRTAVKDIQDIVFIFFSLAIGMAAGVGLHRLAFIGTLSVGVVLWLLASLQTTTGKRREYLLQFSYTPEDSEDPPYLPVIESHCTRHHLVNSRAHDDGEILDLAFYVSLRDRDRHGDLARDLARTDRVSNVSLFFDEEEF
jgi:uncharacterized membrane protein YhiD involved in acid resistance